MKAYAHIQEGLVVDTFETEGDITEMFHPSWLWVEITGLDVKPKSGWKAEESDRGWTFLQTEPVLSTEQLKFLATSQRDSLLSKADNVTLGMADAFITGILSDKDALVFKQYAAYKLALNKIVQQVGYPENIEWPAEPTLTSL